MNEKLTPVNITCINDMKLFFNVAAFDAIQDCLITRHYAVPSV